MRHVFDIQYMSTTSTTAEQTDAFPSTPEDPIGYVAILLAAITGAVHLFLAPNVIGFSQTLAILFALNGLGFLGGIVLYLSPYWRRELYLVAALYAVVTILALLAFNDWAIVQSFYMQGDLNPMAVVSKSAEALLAVCALYLYASEA